MPNMQNKEMSAYGSGVKILTANTNFNRKAHKGFETAAKREWVISC